MYLNRVTLIGYLARDANSRTAREGPPYVSLELATKESWKDSSGAWQSRSEIHRCVVWGQKLVASASGLKKGAHVQIEGSLRSREFDKAGAQVRVWEIRVTSIAKVESAVKPGETDPASDLVDSSS